ncbi:MAG: PEP-CTERM sorting domain-containing protein [Akkermansiaceae bacterium]|nr:PEP-CTERM sorting domain-containing protein [Akkermansiaceae bacterium]
MKKKLIMAAMAAAVIPSASAATSFTDDFGDSSIDSEWNKNGVNWVEGAGELSVTGIGGPSGAASYITTSTVPSDTAFTLTMDFHVTSVTASEQDWAGVAWNFGSAASTYIWRVRTENGRATITEWGGDINLWSSAVEGPGDFGALTANNTYRLTVVSPVAGTFSAELIDIDGTDGTIYSTGTIVDATHTSGGHFGIYALQPEDNELQVESFSVVTSVPEPSSFALLGLGGLALILRRRK